MCSTLQERLRTQTHVVHQRLHEHPLFVSLFDGTITLAQYCGLMTAFYGFYLPLERSIDGIAAQSEPLSASFTYQKRSDFLAKDLADLGQSSHQIARNPLCAEIETVVTPASLGGVLYVIEGSTLGAALIDRAAQKILCTQTTRGRSFWAWNRAHNREQWRAINIYLDHLDTIGHPKDALIQGAIDTFQVLATWLEPLEKAHATKVGPGQ